MIDALFSQPNYVAAKKMLEATVRRHEAIASNLANLERPNYKRLDLAPSFAQELRQAIAAKDPAQIAALEPTLAVDTSAAPRTRDGNTVHLESELLKLNQNSLAHALETQLITSSLLRLRTAISGRPT
ncbi:MAG: flagellar basal body rod protein FlgB [Verrucomicrobia bacterium]|nr:flagellar basal body rod protein FlgB [Verrucomicrobiota bacterium]